LVYPVVPNSVFGGNPFIVEGSLDQVLYAHNFSLKALQEIEEKETSRSHGNRRNYQHPYVRERCEENKDRECKYVYTCEQIETRNRKRGFIE